MDEKWRVKKETGRVRRKILGVLIIVISAYLTWNILIVASLIFGFSSPAVSKFVVALTYSVISIVEVFFIATGLAIYRARNRRWMLRVWFRISLACVALSMLLLVWF